ncbi:EAL domain-containing protein [Thiorhodococcus mannitoliphagus]|uniref:bifunctional diguanylate cyclase/phosphodiesterase n=1 Tax=Thiorhodococcus mannitoliphagus TaxID=329406 RepID=UPI0019813899|nr:EAL domain-containing protein [Thiorhodococcus mannitoliphagus]
MDVNERRQFESTLTATANFVAAPNRGRFCEAVVRHAAETLGLDHVHVAQLIPGQRSVATRAAWRDGQPVPNWSYDLAFTPCEQVLSTGHCIIESEVDAQYPRDEDLKRLGAKGYIGEPILDSAGEVLGLIVGITRAPLTDTDLVHANLRILAARAGAEFEQREAMDKLRHERDTIHNILQTVEAIILALDVEGRITLINRKGRQLLGYQEAELIGEDWFSTCLPSDIDVAEIRNIHRKIMIEDMAGAEYLENPIRTRSGEERLIAWHNNSIRDTQGRVIGSLSAGEDITDRCWAERKLADSEVRYRLAFHTSPDSININRLADGRYLDVNEGFERLTGWSRDEVIGKRARDLGIWHDLAARRRLVDALARHGYRENLEARFRRKNGEIATALISAHLITLDGEPCIFSITRDITDKKRAEEALRDSEARANSILRAAPVGIGVVVRRLFIEVNETLLRMTGYSQEELIGQSSRLLYPSDAEFESVGHEKYVQIREQGIGTVETRWQRKDGSVLNVILCSSPIDPADLDKGVTFTAQDITTRKESEERIRNLAYFDPLTGLPNRRLLLDRLEHALIASHRSRQYGALMMLDLDHFKTINDTQGHDIGDRLLIEVAQRMTASLREDDTVSRLGGDEYVVMLENLGTNEQTAANATEMAMEKIRLALNAPHALTSAEPAYYCTPSIGLTLFRGHETSIEVLLKQADVALYQAKDAGRNTARFFNPTMQKAIESRMALESALRQALLKGELQLFYQPQIDQHGHCFGAEALLRWRRPDRGLVSPMEFIPLAEETGLILPIGQWVMDTACAQLKAWESDERTRSLRMAVNVSARQFHQPDFVAQVQASLERSGANPRRLKLELTESVVLENAEQVVSRMNQLKALGVSFSMDDFGTGYSSLSYLKLLPLDQLKIDKSFVRDIATDPSDAAIVRAILAMSQSLGLEVIAEGVETEEQRRFLCENGCHVFQGYLLGRPRPIEEWAASAEQREDAGQTTPCGSRL